MKKVIATEKAPSAVGPYSQAIEINGMLFVSGQVPIDPATGKLAGDDINSQSRQVLENIMSILAEAGYQASDVVKCTCFLADMEYFRPMNEVYKEYFTGKQPARAAFAVKELPLGALVEIDAIAVTS